MRKTKKFLSLLVTLAMLFSTMVVPSTAAEGDVKTGSCGDNLTYTLTEQSDGNYKMVISGSGDMTDYKSSTSKQTDWYSKVSELIIEEGVTSIGNFAFYDCSALTNVTIPGTVTSIGKSAFFSCSSLTEIILPVGITSIGSNVFFGCSALLEIKYKGTTEQWNAVNVVGDFNGYNVLCLGDEEIKDSMTLQLGDVKCVSDTYSFVPVTVSGVESGKIHKIVMNITPDKNALMVTTEPVQTMEDVTVTHRWLSTKEVVTLEADDGKTIDTDGVLAYLNVMPDVSFKSGEKNLNISSVVFYDEAGNILNIDCELKNGSLTYDADVTIDVIVNCVNGTVNIPGYTVDENNIIKVKSATSVTDLTITPDEGYTYSGYTIEYNLSDGYTKRSSFSKQQLTSLGIPNYLYNNITWNIYCSKEYSVNVDNSKSVGGTISCNSASAVGYNSVSFTCTPDNGYDYGYICYSYIDADTGETITVKQDARSKKLASMPEADVTVWMEFALKHKVICSDEGYKVIDVDGTDLAEQSYVEGAYVQFFVIPLGNYAVDIVKYSIDNGNTWNVANTSNYTGIYDGSLYYAYYINMPDCDVKIDVENIPWAVVNIAETENGSVTMETSSGAPGTDIEFKCTPKEGYRTHRVWYTVDDGDEIDLGAQRKLTMPSSGSITIHAEFIAEDYVDAVINTAADLQALAETNLYGKYYKLGSDIDLSTVTWTTIGDASNGFCSIFDGCGHTISGLTAPLFYSVSGTLKNLTIEGSITNKTSSSAAFAVYGEGEFSELVNKASVTNLNSSSSSTSGIVAVVNGNADFKNCYNYGKIDSNDKGYAGGIVGLIDNAKSVIKFTNCGNYADIYGRGAGILGEFYGKNSVNFESCVNKGKITDDSSTYVSAAAGIVYINYVGSDSSVSINNCYNTGDIYSANAGTKIDATPCAAGIAAVSKTGLAAIAEIKNCYNLGNISCGGAFAGSQYQIGEIIPDIMADIDSYNGVKATEYASSVKGINTCYTGSELAVMDNAVAVLNGNDGNAWKKDAEVVNGYPILSWEKDGSAALPEIFTVTLPSDGNSFKIQAISESNSVIKGGSFSFSVEVSDISYSAVVTANGNRLTAVNDIYTITNIKSNITVTVTLVESGIDSDTVIVNESDMTDGIYTIIDSGKYKLKEGLAGTILVNTAKEVTIIGNGAEWDNQHSMTSVANAGLYIDCTNQSGVNLTLKNIYISNTSSVSCTDGSACGILGFTGTGNTLNFEGVNVLDYNIGGGSNPSAIHVKQGDALTIGGTGTLYFYKSAQGAGIGGTSGELNGDITFKIAKMFAKGTKQGALIGAGSASANASGEPGSITFESGEYNLISNSRGAVIGGSAGSTGGSSGTTVYVKKNANININVDYSGAAVGGGGYAEGNDSSGGTLYVDGGSLRTYVDTNAANNANTGYNGASFTAGINDAAITAARKNSDEETVYKCIFDTSALDKAASTFTVKVDGKEYYTGGLHKYGYVQEGLDKDMDEQLTITSTPSNWYENNDSNLYLYLTGENHVIEVNGETFTAVYDESAVESKEVYTAGAFSVSKGAASGGDDESVKSSITVSAGEVKDGKFDLNVTCSGHGFEEVANGDIYIEFRLLTDPELSVTYGEITAKQGDIYLSAEGYKNEFCVYKEGMIYTSDDIVFTIPVILPADSTGTYTFTTAYITDQTKGYASYFDTSKSQMVYLMPSSEVKVIPCSVNVGSASGGNDENISISIGNGSAAGTTVDGVTTFKAGTSENAPTVTVTAPENGWKAGENTFTVSADKACTVIVKNADGTYTKLAAAAVSDADNTYSFTTSESFDADCEIIVSMTGDIDGDGAISQADYLSVLSAIRGASLEGPAELRADVNSDSSISQVDYLSILSAIRGASLSW